MALSDVASREDQAADGIETKKTYCRFCHAYCAMEVDVKDGKPIAVRGDRDDPIYNGYSCIKGRQLVEHYDHPGRITQPLKKMPDGTFKEIPMEQALDEIAKKVDGIIRSNGPRSIASYCGTYSFQESAALNVCRAFHKGIGSDSFYTSVTIDQPGKALAQSRFGTWGGGIRGFDESDVMMIVGCNTVVSQYAPPGGIPWVNPSRRYQDTINRGATVICIDPRLTEVARKAHYFLQIRPGEDPTLLGGMVRLILEEELHDKEFCDQYMDGLDELKAAVGDFTPDYVAKRAGVDKDLFMEATRAFANGNVGRAFTGTGPDMAAHGNLTEHFILVLNTILGRYAKEGEVSAYPAVISPMMNGPRKAQVIPANPAFGKGPRNRVRGLGEIIGEMPTAALADEILEPGEGQVKALFCAGGNPIVAWPDQLKTKRAMDELDLLVCIDVKMSATPKLADYILPGKICLEREDATVLSDIFYEEPYSHYTKAVCEPNGDLIEEWEFYWEIAHRLGSEIKLQGGNLDMDVKPSKLDVLEAAQKGARVSLEELRDHEGGKLFEDVEIVVEPGSGDAKFQMVPEGIVEEIREIRSEQLTDDGRRQEDKDYSHLLVSRRLKHVYNSSGQEHTAIQKKGTTNPAYMNPDDVKALGIASGDIVQITGKHGQILGVAEATPELQPGVVSMAHAWGDLPSNDGNVREIGSSTNRLLATDKEFDPITGMARQSAIPVNVRPIQL